MDLLQVIALACEIIGFSLALVHIYQSQLIEIMNKRVESNFDAYFGVFTALDGADADMTESEETRDAKAFNNYMIIILGMILWIPVYLFKVEYGSGIGWGFLELIVAYFYAFLIAMGFRLVLVIAAAILVGILLLAGRGNIVVGFGFILAAVGFLFELYQVYYGDYWWIAATIVCVIGVVGSSAAWAWMSRRSLSYYEMRK